MKINWTLTLLLIAAIAFLPQVVLGIGALVILAILLAVRLGARLVTRRLIVEYERRLAAERKARMDTATEDLARMFKAAKEKLPDNVVRFRKSGPR